jgi:alpha-beta hydrolase superfamily lysophospholipase
MTNLPADTRKRRRRRWKIRAAIIFVSMFIGINALAFMQAWSMTHFADRGAHTPTPGAMSFGRKVEVMLTGVTVPRPYNRKTPAASQMDFTTRHVQEPGFDLETWSVPAAGKPRGLVLMFHGYAACKSTLLIQGKHLHDLGYALDMVDFRGSGGSSGNRTTIGYVEADDVVATVADARAHLLSPGEPLILFGQSMGAAAVLRAVGDKGVSTDAIVIESPYDRLLSTAGNRFHAMNLPAFPLAHIMMFWGGLQQGFWSFAMNPEESATRVHVPVLMFHGQLDTTITPEQAHAVFNHLAGPKRLEWCEHAPHASFVNTDPARWDRAVSDFLTRYAGNSRPRSHS